MAEPIKKNLKARPKAGPSRIVENISNKNVIRDEAVHANSMIHIAESEDLSLETLPDAALSLPMEFWLANKDALSAHVHQVAVQIAADQEVSDLADELNSIDVIVLPFVTYVDGRSYSLAYMLRTQFAYKGEIRAVGDVHYDHLDFLARVGVNAFELPDSDNQEAALEAFKEFTEVYQPSADEGRLVFARRRTVH